MNVPNSLLFVYFCVFFFFFFFLFFLLLLGEYQALHFTFLAQFVLFEIIQRTHTFHLTTQSTGRRL
jgi:hypothetical protein